MKYLLIGIILINIVFLSGCVLDSMRDSEVDYSGEIFALKAEKENLKAEREKLADMMTSAIEKTKTGAITINDAQTLFNEINKSRDKISESISNVSSKVSDMERKAKEKSEETGVPWWIIMLGNAAFSVLGIKNRTKFGLSEAGYAHK